MDGSSGGQVNSSDFVRKLYKMLESPSDESVVRWGNEGDSFVVLENEKFTKHILPKHFKHSNFASFVRQLNKYDFHKVRHNTEDGVGSLYGASAWEFKHPEFKMNNKEGLDSIRRKAPAARKNPPPADDMLVPSHQIDMLNSQLVATQQQVTQLQDRNTELQIQYTSVAQEVVNLKTLLMNHDQILGYVVNAFMSDYDKRARRQSRIFPNSSSAELAGHNITSTDSLQPSVEDESPPSPLLQASKLLSETNLEAFMNSRVDQSTSGLLTSPDLNGRASTGSAPPSAGSTGTAHFRELDNLVYPVGHSNNGIDPMYGDHLSNIPYSMPISRPLEPPISAAPTPIPRKPAHTDIQWVRQPQILLVEDDNTCRKIGTRFLSAFHCNVITAHDGVQAVEKARSGVHFDLILMDIIMPNLDGVSACHLIRQQADLPVPIIAMTSNIRTEDINLYYEHGMSDILPKPFTREGLHGLLSKHLNHIRKRHISIKDEDPLALASPDRVQTPTSTTWSNNSPQTVHSVTGPSPEDALLGATLFSQQALNPNGLQYVQQPITQMAGQRRALDPPDDLSGGGKRQQTMYGISHSLRR